MAEETEWHLAVAAFLEPVFSFFDDALHDIVDNRQLIIALVTATSVALILKTSHPEACFLVPLTGFGFITTHLLRHWKEYRRM